MLVKGRVIDMSWLKGGGGGDGMGCDDTSGIDTLLLLGTHLSIMMHH